MKVGQLADLLRENLNENFAGAIKIAGCNSMAANGNTSPFALQLRKLLPNLKTVQYSGTPNRWIPTNTTNLDEGEESINRKLISEADEAKVYEVLEVDEKFSHKWPSAGNLRLSAYRDRAK